MSRSGILLVGHGTRNAAGIGCVERLRDLVEERLSEQEVRHCFLELHAQTIQRGMDELIACGVSKVVVVPLLLFAAGHAKSDIPRECLAAAAGRVELRMAEALGCHPALVELSRIRYSTAVARQVPSLPEETCLLLVGRGSFDAQATAEMHRFADLRRQQMPGVEVQVGFIAMASPSLPEVVGQLSQTAIRRVVLQPHLLFRGDLLDNLGELVEKQRSLARTCDWLMTDALAEDLGQYGPADRLLTDAVIERAENARFRLAAER